MTVQHHHTLGSNVDVYFERMRASIGDKKRMIGYVVGQDVLDVGCGSGELVRYLNSEGWSACGLDPSHEAILKSREIGVDCFEGFADEAASHFSKSSFDTILCSSVFHEIFSYGNRDGRQGRLTSLMNALMSFSSVHRKGGRLIIRDGVMPTYPTEHDEEVVSMTAPVEAVRKFLAHSPFAGQAAEGKDRNLVIWPAPGSEMDEAGSQKFHGTASSLMEFAFTYTWGDQSFEREVKEFYGVFTLDGMEEFVSQFDYRLVESFAYTQPGYPEHLEGKVKFDFPFPHSNAIWVFERI